VVFTNENNKIVKPTYKSNFPKYEELFKLEAPYNVDFTNKDIGPKEPIVFNDLIDWSKSEDEHIKYYSGTAVYSTTFNLDEVSKNQDIFINLGNISVMAKVKLNGTDIGGVWLAPYRLNISDAIKTGENTLEIEVVNLWRNQLIKDKQRPDAEKYTWLVTDDIKPEDKLQPSGLLGPVVIETVKY
tara:strand:- start:548 stop:1102 length:555 start_codon:yes stop_codon:yes gene_type:complete